MNNERISWTEPITERIRRRQQTFPLLPLPLVPDRLIKSSVLGRNDKKNVYKLFNLRIIPTNPQPTLRTGPNFPQKIPRSASTTVGHHVKQNFDNPRPEHL